MELPSHTSHPCHVDDIGARRRSRNDENPNAIYAVVRHYYKHFQSLIRSLLLLLLYIQIWFCFGCAFESWRFAFARCIYIHRPFRCELGMAFPERYSHRPLLSSSRGGHGQAETSFAWLFALRSAAFAVKRRRVIGRTKRIPGRQNAAAIGKEDGRKADG